MKEKLPKIIFVILAILIFVNLVFLDWWIIRNRGETDKKTDLSREIKEESVAESGQKEVSPATCSETCQQLIDQKISEAIAKIPTQATGKTITYIAPTSVQTFQ